MRGFSAHYAGNAKIQRFSIMKNQKIITAKARKARRKTRRKSATDGAPIDTDEIKLNCIYRCSSVPHRWQNVFLQKWTSLYLPSRSSRFRGQIIFDFKAREAMQALIH